MIYRSRLLILFVFILVSLSISNSHILAQQNQDSTDTAIQSIEEGLPKIPGTQNIISQSSKIWRFTLSKVFWSVIVFVVALILMKYITRLLETLAERWTRFRLTIKSIIPVIRIFGWTTVLYLIIAGILAPPIETIIAVTASAGIAVGFASQDILKNIFGGIMILFDRPFQVGDKIQIGQHYGEVRSIGLRTVRIVTPDDSLVSVPNSEIVNQSVSNANSGESNCQVVAEFYLPPDIDVSRTKLIAYRAAAVSRYVYLNKPIGVILKNEIHQGRSLLKMRVKAYVFDIRFEFPFMSEMTETIMGELLASRLISPSQFPLISQPPITRDLSHESS
ncbi:MAG: mechanosensitive ion channel [bacterium]|nr:MAG: mechanosensitive ion channel [bacterium]